MNSIKSKKWLSLLGGVMLLAALAVAAFFFRAGDPSSSTTNAPKGAPGADLLHDLVQGADAEKVKAWMHAYRQASAQAELGNKEAAQEHMQRLKQELASSDLNTRLAMHLERLYSYEDRGQSAKIHEWLVWIGTKMIADGEDDDEIASRLHGQLVTLREYDGEEMDKQIQQRRKIALGVYDPFHYDPRDPSLSDKENRIREYFYNHYGSVMYHEENGRTPRAVIDILVEGMDDMTAAKYLYGGGRDSYFSEAYGERWVKSEETYAAEYADRVLAKDPTSRDALLIKVFAPVDLNDAIESSQRLLKHHPDDEEAVRFATGYLFENYPEETVAAISRFLPREDLHFNPMLHFTLGNAYERLDMIYEAADQYQLSFAAGLSVGRDLYERLERGDRNYPSIWEERGAANPPEPAPPSERS